MSFGRRLRELREEKELTQEQFGEIFNFKKALISKYENDKLQPSIETINSLADYFDVSSDYLLGRTDNRNTANIKLTNDYSKDTEELVNMIFPKRLKELRTEKDISQEELGSMLNLSKSTISLYESGKRESDFNTLNKIAQYFNVSTDYLLGNSDIREVNKIQLPKYYSKYTGEPIDLDRPYMEKTLADATLRITELIWEFDMPGELFTALIKKAVQKYGPPRGVGGIAAHTHLNMPGTGAPKEDDDT